MIVLREFQKKVLSHFSYPFNFPRHVLCVAPTGSGKSLIYETLAKQKGRKVLLITPLIALARQQFHQLKLAGVPVIHGIKGLGEDCMPQSNDSGAWILSPEALQSIKRKNALLNWKPNLLVIDECHCIWEWGESFRPYFSEIPKLIQSLSISQSLWLTATLPKENQKELQNVLTPYFYQIGEFDLPSQLNVHFKKLPLVERMSYLIGWMNQQRGPGIIFVSTRASTDRIANLLKLTGKRIAVYHAGLSREERFNLELKIQKNEIDIIVSTSAFGMGMNYPHLVYVVLWQVPTSVLSLVQSIGRVGRGKDKMANALIFWDLEDFQSLEWTIKDSKKRIEELLSLKNILSENNCRRISLKQFFNSNVNHENPKDITANHLCRQCDFCNNVQTFS